LTSFIFLVSVGHQLQGPNGLALRKVGPKETVLVSEENNHRVSEFDMDGTFIRHIGLGEGNGPGQLEHPYDVTIVPGSGEIAVADSFNHRVCIFDGNTGKFARTFGTKGKVEPGTFSYPVAITADPNGHLLVLDTYTTRLQVFRYLFTRLDACSHPHCSSISCAYFLMSLMQPRRRAPSHSHRPRDQKPNLQRHCLEP
jgi:DNA-binding beta-propeller fold protein YncE